jgi:hypothetical protein
MARENLARSLSAGRRRPRQRARRARGVAAAQRADRFSPTPRGGLSGSSPKRAASPAAPAAPRAARRCAHRDDAPGRFRSGRTRRSRPGSFLDLVEVRLKRTVSNGIAPPPVQIPPLPSDVGALPTPSTAVSRWS